jgi:hypothetical protein
MGSFLCRTKINERLVTPPHVRAIRQYKENRKTWPPTIQHPPTLLHVFQRRSIHKCSPRGLPVIPNIKLAFVHTQSPTNMQYPLDTARKHYVEPSAETQSARTMPSYKSRRRLRRELTKEELFLQVPTQRKPRELPVSLTDDPPRLSLVLQPPDFGASPTVPGLVLPEAE